MSTDSHTKDQASGDQESAESGAKLKRVFWDFKIVIAAFSVLIPLVVGYFEYKEAIERSQDTIFREIVKDLSSKETQNRVTGATNLGAYIRDDNKYHDVAVDILINFVALETDSDVLNAISWSLQKIDKQYYSGVLDKLLDLNRNMFLNDYVTSKRVDIAIDNFNISMDEMLNIGSKLRNARPEDKAYITEFAAGKEWREKITRDELSYIYTLRKVNLDMEDRRMLTANFIASFLTINPLMVKSVKFRQNSLNYILIEDINLSGSTLVNSAFSLNIMKNINFSHSEIVNTVFTDSLLDESDFSNSTISLALFDFADLKTVNFSNVTFSDVFFLYANLENADFTGAQRLQPLYFYRARNKDKATFDDAFRKQMEETVVTDKEFTDYIAKSKLSNNRYNALIKSLKTTDKYFIQDEEKRNEADLMSDLLGEYLEKKDALPQDPAAITDLLQNLTPKSLSKPESLKEESSTKATR